MELSKEYAELYNKAKEIDKEYSQKHKDAIKAFNDYIIENSKSENRKTRSELYADPKFNELYDAEDIIVDEWQKVNRENDMKAKEALTKALKANGYDGVILKNDVGSFGRTTEAYIVLDNTQVKSATDNIGTFDKTNPDIRYSINEPESEIAQLKDNLKAAQIREENLSSTINTQQQIIKSLKAEFEITKGHILNRSKIEVLAKKLLYKYSSSYDSAKLSDNLQKLFDYIANDKNVDWYSAMDVSTAIAKEIISKSTLTNRDLYNQYSDMREYFRKTKFNIPEELRAEVGEYYGGWNNFRRQNFGRFNLTNEGYSLDSYWNEISETYPEFFDAEATPQEQVMQVVSHNLKSLKLIKCTNKCYEATKRKYIPHKYNVERTY